MQHDYAIGVHRGVGTNKRLFRDQIWIRLQSQVKARCLYIYIFPLPFVTYMAN